MEVEHLLVPGGCGFHFTVRLVSNAVVNDLQVDWRKDCIKSFLLVMRLIARKESSTVLVSLHESVSSVSIGLNRCADHFAFIIFERVGLSDRLGSPINCFLVDSSCVINCKRDIFDTVSVLGMVSVKFGVLTILR